jgi:hypothetical protein
MSQIVPFEMMPVLDNLPAFDNWLQYCLKFVCDERELSLPIYLSFRAVHVLFLIYTHDESSTPLRISALQTHIPTYSRQFFHREIKTKLNHIMPFIAPELGELTFRNMKRALQALFTYVSHRPEATGSGIDKVAYMLAHRNYDRVVAEYVAAEYLDNKKCSNQDRNFLIEHISHLIINHVTAEDPIPSLACKQMIANEVKLFIERLTETLRKQSEGL